MTKCGIPGKSGSLRFFRQTQVELNTNLLLRDDEYFERADEFIPERWLRSDATPSDVTTLASKDPFAMLPFSHGARSCIGGRKH